MKNVKDTVEQVKVGIADYKITQAPNSLITIGLGSCIGIALYDRLTKKGALLHIMLADSTKFNDTSKWEKFADLAIPKVAKELTKSPNRLVAKIAGGASLFQTPNSVNSLQIGQRNIEMVKQVLDDLSIPILGEHVGGDSGRTMIVDLETFEVKIRMVNRDIHNI